MFYLVFERWYYSSIGIIMGDSSLSSKDFKLLLIFKHKIS
ncbi:hypothetical protein LSO10F_30079 [Candidatus Liberibacter solanacearum]